MRIGILHIGDELLTGDIDPYPKEMVRMIRSKNNVLDLIMVVGDIEEDIVASLRYAEEMGINILVITGGLGPTLDDVTREAVSKYLDAPLIQDQQAVSWLDDALARMSGRSPPFRKERLKMALVPEGAIALRNITGAACGIEATKNCMTFFCFPGFPNEMVPMFEKYVLPRILIQDHCEMDMRVMRGEAAMEPLFQKVVQRFDVRIASLPSAEWRKEGNKVIIKGKKEEVEKAFAFLNELMRDEQ